VDVLDYGVIPIPVSRQQMGDQREMGGVHVRLAPSDPEIIEVRLYREGGRELDTNERNAVDRLFFQLDFRRAAGDAVGEIAFPDYGTGSYEKAFLKALDREAIKSARFRIVTDYSFGSTLKMLPALLGKLGVEVVSLNAHIDDEKVTRTTRQFDRAVKQISEIVQGLDAALGSIVSASGETLFLVDGRGRWVDGGKLLLCLAQLTFRTCPECLVAVPASASSSFEFLARKYGGEVMRTPINPSALLDGAVRGGAHMAGNSEGGVSFLDFHPSFDAMFCLGKLLELLAANGDSLEEVVDSLPENHLLHSIVPCAWETKGKVMRRLVEELGEESKGIEGVRFDQGAGWVLIYPSSNHACFHVFAESADREEAGEILKGWSRRVGEMQE
jgi:mannose-1-phosphate guanylyltransferase/phosphomannomutase